jgi:hypothetical protein
MDNLVVMMFSAVIIVGVMLLIAIGLAKQKPVKIDREYYQNRMRVIEDMIGDNNSANLMAVMDADKLLDSALRAKGVRGNGLGDRLKGVGKRKVFHNLNAVWAAHKLRNRIAHEDDIKLSAEQTRKVISVFRGALKDLNVL